VTDRHADEEFRDFVVARGRSLFRTAYLLTGDRHLAEDLVQAALERVYPRWGTFQAAAAEAYVRKVMVREQVAWWRRRRVNEVLTAALPEPRRTVDDAERLTDRLTLQTALMTLGRRQRAVVVLRYFEDLTEQQVADELGISVGTVKSQAHKALAHLRASCGDLKPAKETSR
jgi:RNA polymerase sigma-70 factor (sigma-E family)